MRKTVIQRNNNQWFQYWFFLIFLFGLVWSLAGCGDSENSGFVPEQQFPSFREVLENDTETFSESSGTEEVVLPVKIYFDNTGSMEAFTINSEGKRIPCSAYANLVRCLRDMGRMQDTQYYVLDIDEQDWVLYEDGIYDNFDKEDFYVWWKAGQPGPLSKLYMNNRIDDTCINIVLTDLAEQNLNNTQLAEQIRKMCDEKGCEADLYAFKFDFNGLTQSPNPGAMARMVEGMVNGEKPYYMIITGPSKYMVNYREELQGLLKSSGLQAGADYFTISNRVSIDHDFVGMPDVVFEPFADFDEIRQEAERQQKADRKNSRNEDEDTLEDEDEGTGLVEKSKNLQRYTEVNQIMEDSSGAEAAVFYYQKVEGVGIKNGDWRLNYYVPLNNWGNPQLRYTYKCHIYRLEQMEAGTEPDQQEENGPWEWVEDADPRIEISMEVREDIERDGEQYPAVLYISCKDKEVEKKHEPREKDLLLILEITKENIYSYEKPDWLADFDTGDTDDYLTRTFNLIGFYDVLFGNRSKLAEDGMVHIWTNYAQVPVLLIDLNE